MSDEDAGLARKLVEIMNDASGEVLSALGEELKRRTIADIPVGDPALDPDPKYRLADHVHVRVYGNFVSVSVEGAYAVKQHEALAFKHPRGGYPKFLERNAVVLAVQMQGKIEGVLARRFVDVRRGRVRDRTVETYIGPGR